jgi:XTP/dITP diphosphohydrolase
MSATAILLIATSNSHKVREINPFFGGLTVELIGLADAGISDVIEEEGDNFAANARLKALHYHRLSGLPTLADDSGLVIDALDGDPGVHSSRYLGADVPHSAKIAHILERMRDVPDGQRQAHFACSIAFAHQGAIFSTITKRVFGTITREPRGEGGFGYDPIFFCPEIGCTFAQASSPDKNRVSHRGKAVLTFVQLLETHTQLRRELGIGTFSE